MEELRSSIASGDHEKILAMKDAVGISEERLNCCRAVAAIQLGRFDEAARLAARGSFEQGYALYRQKRFKKALRMLKETGTRCDILKAQCLYNLGFYAEAHRLLCCLSTENEYAVNLAAIESLCTLASELRFSPSFAAPPFKGHIKNTIVPTLTDKECAVEFEFNRAYVHVSDERVYLRLLSEIDQKFNGAETLFKKQLLNLRGELEDDSGLVNSLGRREQEIVNFNSGSGLISCPVHFQVNFVPGTQQNTVLEYIAAEKSDPSLASGNPAVLSKRYKDLPGDIQPVSEVISIIKALSRVKRFRHEVHSGHISRILKNVGSCPERDILLLVSSDLDDSEFQDRAMALIDKLSSL